MQLEPAASIIGGEVSSEVVGMMETIEGSGYPLGFLAAPGKRPSLLDAGAGRTTYVTEARLLGGHQKEAVVHEGSDGPRWRLTSDEGPHLGGKDVAPFPLGFFNAGLQGDIAGRVQAAAGPQGIDVDDLRLFLQNFYWLTGSFVKGTGEGFADPPRLRVSGADPRLEAVTQAAVRASPAADAVARALPGTFALYVNGHRQKVDGMPASGAADAPDPFITYHEPPAPLGESSEDVLGKTGEVEEGTPAPAAPAADGRLLRVVSGRGRPSAGGWETDAWLENMPGFSHFRFRSDERPESQAAPSALAHINAGVAFCFMTQLARYIGNMKLQIGGIRLVQYWPFEVAADGRGLAGPVDTHLFMNGRADRETHRMLLKVAARTCYLHATLAASVPLEVVRDDVVAS